MLYQLPNGNYIDLSLVVGIRFEPRTESLPPRVYLDLRNGIIEYVPFEFEEDAETFRDNLAGMCNNAMMVQWGNKS